jgi:hypothetical protein
VTWRPATSEERQLAWLWGVAFLATVLLRPLWSMLGPLLPACPLRTLTGIPCPTCGSTRAAFALQRADLVAALHFNPLATAAGLAFALGGVLAPLWATLKLPAPDLPARWPLPLRLAVVAIIAVNWLWLLGTS